MGSYVDGIYEALSCELQWIPTSIPTSISEMTPDLSMLLLPLLAASTIPALLYFLSRNRQSSSYPPGPKVKSLPTDDVWVKFRNWGEGFGEWILNLLIVNTSHIIHRQTPLHSRYEYIDSQWFSRRDWAVGETFANLFRSKR